MKNLKPFWMFPPIPHGSKDCIRNKSEIINRIISETIRRNLSFIIVKTKQSYFSKNDFLNIKVYNGSFQIFAIDSIEYIEDCIKCVSKIRLWHKPIFHILIAKSNFINSMQVFFEQNTNPTVEYFDKKLREEIVGVINPIDDFLEVYGTDEVKDLIDATELCLM